MNEILHGAVTTARVGGSGRGGRNEPFSSLLQGYVQRRDVQGGGALQVGRMSDVRNAAADREAVL